MIYSYLVFVIICERKTKKNRPNKTGKCSKKQFIILFIINNFQLTFFLFLLSLHNIYQLSFVTYKQTGKKYDKKNDDKRQNSHIYFLQTLDIFQKKKISISSETHTHTHTPRDNIQDSSYMLFITSCCCCSIFIQFNNDSFNSGFIFSRSYYSLVQIFSNLNYYIRVYYSFIH